MKHYNFLILIILLVSGCAANKYQTTESNTQKAPAVNNTPWYDTQRNLRIEITLDPVYCEINNQIAELDLDLNALLIDADIKEKLNEQSIRVIEVDADGQPVDTEIPCQFNNHRWLPGRLFILLQNNENSTPQRHYQLYFNTGDQTLDTSTPTPLITCEKDVFDEDQNTFKITTDNATFFYQQQGAGLSSLVDTDDIDWINYHPDGKDQGEWRGIANMGWSGLDSDPGFGHPGYTTGQSELISTGPLCITIRSWSNNGKWEAFWDFYPTHAKLTVTRKPNGRPFWFLYEGTPGGKFTDNDICVRPDGVTTPLTESWGEKLGTPGKPATVYFASKSNNRSLFFIHLDNDDHIDSYYKLRTMTVFGFGRGAGKQGLKNYLQKLPNRFIIGLADSTDYDQVSKVTDTLAKEINITAGTLQIKK